MLNDLKRDFNVDPPIALLKACKGLDFEEPGISAQYLFSKWKQNGELPKAIRTWLKENYYGESDCGRGSTAKRE